MSRDPSTVLWLIDAFRGSKAMFTAVALGVFDRLQSRADTAERVAEEIGADPGALERLLDACAGLGLLEKCQGSYRNAPPATEFLCRSSPTSLAGYVLYSDSALYPMWADLEGAVREGSHRWERTFGAAAPIFSHFFRTEEAKRDFISGMHGFGLLSSPAVVAAFDLSRFRRLADLGGATGHLALAACDRYPDLRCVVFELPEVVALGRDYVGRSPHPGRIEIVAGDFFRDPLPVADLYALGRILHDWREDMIQLLLRRVFESLPSGGAILLAEKLLSEDKTGPLPALLQSLNMLVCTEGRERTIAEYASLLQNAGFSEVEGRWTGAPLDAVLAVKR